MCEECRNDAVSAGMSESEAEDFLNLLNELFPEPPAPQDYLNGYGLAPEFELSGEFMGTAWVVKVAEIPADKQDAAMLAYGGQWWVMQGYSGDKLAVSAEASPPEMVTAEVAAKTYAEFHFGYVF
jgi:hypothetical protein